MSDYFPQDLLAQILVRIPAKSLLRFKSVSKSWLSLISSPNFINLHTQFSSQRTPRKLLLKVCLKDEKFSNLHQEDQLELTLKPRDSCTGDWVDFPYTFCGFGVVGSCNGLFSLCDCASVCGYTNNIVLWNPSIRRKLALPIPSHRRPMFTQNTNHSYGFGFDSVNNDYKVVRITYNKQTEMVPHLVEVFSIKTGAWRYVEPPRDIPIQAFISSVCWGGAFVKGALHWVVVRELCPQLVTHCSIMTFDVSAESFGTIKLPEYINQEEWNDYIRPEVIGDSLGVIRSNDRNCNIWVMREYDCASSGSWTLIYKVENSGSGVATAIKLKTNGDTDADLLVAHCNGEIVRCNTMTGKSCSFQKFGKFHDIYVDVYIDSLEMLNEGTSVGVLDLDIWGWQERSKRTRGA